MKTIEVSKFSYDIIHYETEEDKIGEVINLETIKDKNKLNLFDISLKIDGKYFKDYFNEIDNQFLIDLVELLSSVPETNIKRKYQGKRYWFFTCFCGEPGCDGWGRGMDLDVDETSVSWMIYDYFEPPIKLIFRKDEYLRCLQKIIRDLVKIYQINPEAEFFRYLFDMQHILDCIENLSPPKEIEGS